MKKRTLFFLIIAIIVIVIYLNKKKQSVEKNQPRYLELQKLLNAKGYNISENGIYTQETDDALTNWSNKTGKGVVAKTSLDTWVSL